MNKIVVPVDFSEDAVNALEYAIEFANRSSSDLVMVYVVKTGRFDFMRGVETVASKGDFEEFQLKYQPKLKGKLSWEIRKGGVSSEIINLANEIDAWMIIIGSHGVSGFMENWLGSVAFKVVSQSKCPVLTVRSDYKKRDVEKIVMPIDSSFASRHKIPATMELALVYGALVNVVGTAPKDDKEEEFRIKKFVHQSEEVLHKHHVRTTHDMVYGQNVAKIALEHAINTGADLIAIMTDTDEDLSKMILGGYAQYLVHNSPIPILSVHPRNDLVVKDYMS